MGLKKTVSASRKKKVAPSGSYFVYRSSRSVSLLLGVGHSISTAVSNAEANMFEANGRPTKGSAGCVKRCSKAVFDAFQADGPDSYNVKLIDGIVELER